MFCGACFTIPRRYKGWVPQFLVAVPYSSLMFGVYSWLRPDPTHYHDKPKDFYIATFMAGMASGMVLAKLPFVESNAQFLLGRCY